MEWLNLDNIVSAVGGALAVWGAWFAWQKYRGEAKKEDARGAADIVKESAGFARLLIDERTEWTKQIQQLREEQVRQDVRIGQLQEELAERGERLERVEADNRALWDYAGNLETLLRESGVTAPARPSLYEVPAFARISRPAEPRKKKP